MKSAIKQRITSHERIIKAKPQIINKRDYWNSRAQEFSEYAANTGYPEEFIKILRPRKSWTVLDMACGGGTIAIPLANKVKSITAVDFSERMIEIVEKRSRAVGIENIKTIKGQWEDDWNMLGIGVHDVAIASRSLVGNNTTDLIEKLNRSARKAVYITLPVGSGPVDVQLYKAAGRKFKIKKDYINYYFMLYEMGITANVVFITERHNNHWDSHEDAFQSQRWMFKEMKAKEEDKVRAYLNRNLVRINGYWRLPYSRKCLWALMWWTKNKETG
ncbi:MAG: methyltransferase domain-containing protein [Spirochaetota bacterium]